MIDRNVSSSLVSGDGNCNYQGASIIVRAIKLDLYRIKIYCRNCPIDKNLTVVFNLYDCPLVALSLLRFPPTPMKHINQNYTRPNVRVKRKKIQKNTTNVYLSVSAEHGGTTAN